MRPASAAYFGNRAGPMTNSATTAMTSTSRNPTWNISGPRLTEFEVERLVRPAADDLDLDRVARLVPPGEDHDLVAHRGRPSIDRDDHVTSSQTRLGSRTTGADRRAVRRARRTTDQATRRGAVVE